MATLRCPHPGHGENEVPLTSSNDRVFECRDNHRFYRREESGSEVLVDLISNESYPVVPLQGETPSGAPPRPRLVFMKDVPRVKGDLDFDRLSLSAGEWKILSKVDGRSTLEEVRLLAGLQAEEAERLFHSLIDAGLLEICGQR